MGEEVPLVGPGVHGGWVQEDGIARLTATSLQGKRDEVAKAALGKEVLARKESVVAPQVDLCPSDHSFTQKNGSQLAGLRSGHGRGEEDPSVASGARSRSLQRSRNAAHFGDCEECPCVETPTLAVEVASQKPTGVVGEQRVDAEVCNSADVVLQDSVRQGKVAPRFSLCSRPAASYGGGVTLLAGRSARPSHRIDIVSAPEQGPE